MGLFGWLFGTGPTLEDLLERAQDRRAEWIVPLPPPRRTVRLRKRRRERDRPNAAPSAPTEP